MRAESAVPESRLAILLDSLQNDFVYATRRLVADRRSSILAILALTLGICASTVVFGFVYNVVFQPVPYKGLQRLVVWIDRVV